MVLCGLAGLWAFFGDTNQTQIQISCVKSFLTEMIFYVHVWNIFKNIIHVWNTLYTIFNNEKNSKKKNHSTHCTQLFIELVNILHFN